MIVSESVKAISTTDLQRKGKELLDQLQNGEQETFVIMRSNKQVAVMVSVATYEALIQELNELRAKRS